MEDGINILFQELKLPKVRDVDRRLLDAEITPEEVEKTITSLKNGNACGPDGFPSEVYKTFKSIFAPRLTKMFQHSLQVRKLPKTMATIKEIPKEQKDPEIPSSYTVPDKSLVAWVQIDLKCPSNIFRMNIFLQKTAFGIMFWCKMKLLKSILIFTAW